MYKEQDNRLCFAKANYVMNISFSKIDFFSLRTLSLQRYVHCLKYYLAMMKVCFCHYTGNLGQNQEIHEGEYSCLDLLYFLEKTS